MTAAGTVGSPPIEGFFCLTVIFLQTFSTAHGDWMADDTPLGHNASALLIEPTLAATAVRYFFTNLSRTTPFHAAFILERTLAA